jgi:aryl-alcohol dehydrogenase-like predicted oxidoreductase
MIDFTANDTARIEDNLLDIQRGIDDVVKAGKVRHFGLSDDTAWGIMKYNEQAKEHNLPRVESIQNEFSLLDRSDDPYVAEVCVREDVAYLPWSPLAMGILSGKYLKKPWDKNWRYQVAKDINSDPGSYRFTEQSEAAVKAYMEVAAKHGLDVCQMAIKFCDVQNFVTSTIIGATSMEQLKTDIDAFDIELSDEAMADIDAVYRQYPLPY